MCYDFAIMGQEQILDSEEALRAERLSYISEVADGNSADFIERLWHIRSFPSKRNGELEYYPAEQIVGLLTGGEGEPEKGLESRLETIHEERRLASFQGAIHGVDKMLADGFSEKIAMEQAAQKAFQGALPEIRRVYLDKIAFNHYGLTLDLVTASVAKATEMNAHIQALPPEEKKAYFEELSSKIQARFGPEAEKLMLDEKLAEIAELKPNALVLIEAKIEKMKPVYDVARDKGFELSFQDPALTLEQLNAFETKMAAMKRELGVGKRTIAPLLEAARKHASDTIQNEIVRDAVLRRFEARLKSEAS